MMASTYLSLTSSQPSKEQDSHLTLVSSVNSKFVLVLSKKSSTDTVAPVLKNDYVALANLFAILAHDSEVITYRDFPTWTSDILAALDAYKATEDDVINVLTNNQLAKFNASPDAHDFVQLFKGFMSGFEELAEIPESAYTQVLAGKDSFSQLMDLFLQALASFNA